MRHVMTDKYANYLYGELLKLSKLNESSCHDELVEEAVEISHFLYDNLSGAPVLQVILDLNKHTARQIMDKLHSIPDFNILDLIQTPHGAHVIEKIMATDINTVDAIANTFVTTVRKTMPENARFSFIHKLILHKTANFVLQHLFRNPDVCEMCAPVFSHDLRVIACHPSGNPTLKAFRGAVGLHKDPKFYDYKMSVEREWECVC